MKSRVLHFRFAPRASALLISALALTLALASGSGEPRLDGLQRTATIRQSQGYWLLGADGGVFSFGDAGVFGAHRNRDSDIAGMARTRNGGGLWVVDDDGDVFHYGNAVNYGSRLVGTNDIAGFAARPQGDGYWMASLGGQVWNFGAAGHQGPAVPLTLNRPIVDMAVTPSGQGYWLVASDGGVFSYGDANFYGSTGGIVLNRPIVGMAATPSGHGYWLVATDGGVFSFGDADFFGSTGDLVLNRPVVAMASTGTGKGYWLVATDGGVFSFGDAGFHGSTGGIVLNQPIMAMVPTPLRTVSVLPSAAADAAGVEEDSTVSVDVLANDSGLADGGITVSVIDGPDHGSATVGADGRITYSPQANYNGPDVVVYQVSDVDGDLASAALTLTVAERNDAPVAPNRSLSTNEDVPLSGLVGASDVDGDPLGYTVSADAAHGDVVLGSGSFTYTPVADYHGPDSFTIGVSDGRGATATAVISVTVNDANDPPTVSAIPDTDTDEDTAKGGITFTVDDVDTPLDSLLATGASSDQAVVADARIFVDGSGASRTVTLTPAAEASGPVTVTISVWDGSATTVTQFVLTVNPVNDLPAAAGDVATTDEEVAVDINVLANDTGLGDGGATVSVDAGALDPLTEGTATVNGGTITFTPAPDVCWTVTFDYTVTDIDGENSTGTVSVTINPVNDLPAAAADAATTDEEVAVDIDVLVNDTGLGDGGATVTIEAGTLDPVTEGTALVSGGTITFTPALDVWGTVTFDYRVTDAGGDPSTGAVTVTVNPLNDAPVVSPFENVTVSVGLIDQISIPFTVSDVETLAGTLDAVVTVTSDNPALVAGASVTPGATDSDRTLLLELTPLEVGTATITVTVTDEGPGTEETFELTVLAP